MEDLKPSDFEEQPHRIPRPGRGIFYFFLLLGVFSFGFLVSASGFSTPAFFGSTTALLSESLQGVFRTGSTEKIIQIDLGISSPSEATSSPTSAPSFVVPSPATAIPTKTVSSGNTTLRVSSDVPVDTSLRANAIEANSLSPSLTSLNTTPNCDFSSGGSPTHTLLFNEIAWMGSPAFGGTATTTFSNHEWIEVKNISSTPLDISGWQIVDDSEKFDIVFGNTIIPPGGLYLFERTSDDSVSNISADQIYSGALANAGMWLKIFDASCNVVDEVNASESSTSLTAGGWPGGDNATKQTLERDLSNFGWHTSAVAGGTPKKENSLPVQSSGASYAFGVSLQGDGSGSVAGSSGILCPVHCYREYPAGTKIILTASSSADSVFLGWSGACSGTGDCKLTINSVASVIATFHSTLPPPGQAPSSSGVSRSSSSSSSNGGVLVSEIMAGESANSDYEFIEFYNPTASAVDLTGWSIKKKTSSGTESSLISSSHFDGKSISANGYFLVGNAGGYTGAVAADILWPKSYTLAYSSNSIAIYDASGNKIDEVFWPQIPSDSSYVRESWSSNQFSVSGNPTPQNASSQ